MAEKGKFDALSNKVKEHAANAATAESGTSNRVGSTAKPTTVNSATAKPTTVNSSGAKPTTFSSGAKPSTAAATATAATAKPTTTTSAAKPTTTTTTKPVSTKFTDVPSNAYYAEAVSWAVQKGITSGVTETTFNPNGACHRGHVATFIWRSKGSPAPKTTKNPFTDVSDGPFYKAILWASENGIVPGVTATTFEHTAPCTRAQVLTYLMRAESKADATETDAIKWAALKRLLTGLEGNASSPCTRADIVTFLYRVQGK